RSPLERRNLVPLGASVFLFDNCVHCAHVVRHLFVLGAVAPLLCGAVVRVRETPVHPPRCP
ncbi:MAG TPA: hypothetical protein VIM14_08465, partial [Polyangia bacterium]